MEIAPMSYPQGFSASRQLPASAAAPQEEGPRDTAHLERSTPKTPLLHKAVCGVVAGATLWNVANIAGQIAALPGITSKVLATALTAGTAVAGWAAADLGSGVFHWAVDNYPTRKTPVIGNLAEEFQVHHHEPTSILARSTASNFAQVGMFAALPLLATAIVNPTAAVTAGLTSMMVGTSLSQASHRWTHDRNAPGYTKVFQKLKLSQSRGDHAKHHAMPWDDHYCVVNGMWNPLLSRTLFWRKLEKGVHAVTGREPKSWRDPGVKQLALGEISREDFLKDRKVNRQVFREIALRDYRDYKEHKAARGAA